MINKRTFFLLLSLTTLVCVVVLYGYKALWAEKVDRDLRAQHLKAGDFTLRYNGERFSLSDLRGKPVILYFGYTACPDVCPVGLALIRDVLKQLEDKDAVSVVFISLDPENDTQEKLKDYSAFFHPSIIPLTGTTKELTDVMKAYGGFFQTVKQEGVNSGLIDHSAYFYLLDRELQLIRVFDHGVKRQEFLASLRTLL